jgi:hypothetical protein
MRWIFALSVAGLALHTASASAVEVLTCAARHNVSDHRRLPPVSVIFADLEIYLADAQRGDDQVGRLLSGFKFLGHAISSPKSLGSRDF